LVFFFFFSFFFFFLNLLFFNQFEIIGVWTCTIPRLEDGSLPIKHNSKVKAHVFCLFVLLNYKTILWRLNFLVVEKEIEFLHGFFVLLRFFFFYFLFLFICFFFKIIFFYLFPNYWVVSKWSFRWYVLEFWWYN
jgi:hypothetical protein